MTYATTFSGIGGWELGLDAAGWQLRWQCECDPFCRAILEERFGVPIYGDIRTLLEYEPEPVDCLVGSPPCQPFSVAGKKHGVADPRHLYPAFVAAVRVLRPRWVLMENVAGLLHDQRAFGQYIGGLAEIGYDIVWHSVPACAVGANHERDRLWFIAHAGHHAGRTEQQKQCDSQAKEFEEMRSTGLVSESKEGRTRRGQPCRAADSLDAVVRMMPTPHASMSTGAGKRGEGGSHGKSKLKAMLGTPKSRDWKGGGFKGQLSEQITGQLNPTWCEWLMGFPIGWTVSRLWATRSSRKSRSSSRKPSTQLKKTNHET